MNWGVAMPEVALACLGMAILIFGVLYKPNSAPLATMFTIGALLVTGFLVWTGPNGIGFGGQFTSDAFSGFNKELILLGGAIALILSLDWNRAMGIDRFEYPVLVLFATVGMMIMVSASN
jgi:NADH-quinone oxidoreductase subunit N